MSEPCVIRADYANWRTVAGRKVLQLTFEVPIEQTADVMHKLGVPMPGESKWCAIALLGKSGSANENDAGQPKSAPKLSESIEAPDGHPGRIQSLTPASTAGAGTSGTREKRAFSDMPLSQQAALRCNENRFQFFLVDIDDSNRFKRLGWTAADEVRTRCSVNSRSEILDGTPAGLAWDTLEHRYQSWLTDKSFAEARR